MAKHTVSYLNIPLYPGILGLFRSEAALNKEVKRLKLEDCEMEWPHNRAGRHYTIENERGYIMFVLVNEDKCDTYGEIASLISHEIMHCVQELWEKIGEERPGREPEAYLLQYLMNFCLSEYPQFNKKWSK